MHKQVLPITVFQNEDLVFDLKTRRLLKVSNRLKKNFGVEFISKLKSLTDFEELCSEFLDNENRIIARNFKIKGDQLFDYTLHVNGVKFVVNEISWVNHENNTFHSVIYFQDRHNIFELSYPALAEIVEKMENPAILFNHPLTQALVVNSATTRLLNQPFSELASGFDISDFFVDKNHFNEIINWSSENKSSVLSLKIKLHLGEIEGTWFEMSLFKTSPDNEVLILCILKDISTQIATKEKLKRTNELLSRVVEVQSHFLAKSEGENLYEILLNNILNVIDAKLGFVGKVDVGEEGKPVLRIHAATDISGNSEEAYILYHKHVKDNFLFRHFDNLFGACIVESKIILENDPPSNPHTKGKHIPGHPTIKNFLGVPIFKGNEVIGLIGLANKSGDFTGQDILDLKPFISTYSVIIEAFKSEQEKMRFEKESLMKAEILSEVADNSTDLIVVMNARSEFEFISPAASQFFDEKVKDEEIQSMIRILLEKTINPEYKMSEERYRSRLKLNIDRDSENWVESNVNILHSGNNQTVIAVIRDVSSQIKHEQRLIKSLNKERQFNSFISDFMNIVSHEFKTPLTTIISSMELFKYYLDKVAEVPEITKMKIHHEKIERELANLHKLMIHSLDYERFVNNSPILKKQKVFISRFVEDTLKTHSFSNRVEYISEIDDDLTAEWDIFLIQTSIVNLVSNAVKYGSETRKPIVRLFHDNGIFGIEVKDFGIGILEEDLPYVFIPFFRGANVKGIEGTGFGLVAVKNFVEMHSGDIKIESISSEGTKVVICFKL